jgi:thymidylate synthase
MPQFYFRGDTLDDVMRIVIDEVQRHGVDTSPSRGEASELTGVLLELSNPRARLSRTETRGKLFSCLGELCWYLAKSNAVDFIPYYIPLYRNDAEGDILHGAYGPRLFDFRGNDQIGNVIDLLARHPSSRRAVVQLFDAADLAEEHKDVPCTCSLQFLARGGALHMFTAMRSNDVFLGLPHDVFCFTMIQELVARTLGLELGEYKHAVGSLHLYSQHREDAADFIDEGAPSSVC